MGIKRLFFKSLCKKYENIYHINTVYIYIYTHSVTHLQLLLWCTNEGMKHDNRLWQFLCLTFCEFHSLIKSNVKYTNNFTVFLQTIDVRF